jgi:hypothetical protein
MAFIRKRGSSHQIIETYRAYGKVRQRVLANLGPYPLEGLNLDGGAFTRRRA